MRKLDLLNAAISLEDSRSPPANRLETLPGDLKGLHSIRINELVRGKRGVTPDTAWLLSKASATSPEFWMNLQVAYDLTSTSPPKGVKRLVA
jgi:hypothetical protein